MGSSGRVIAHVDMDAFYASIEIRDDPRLRGKPVVVGGASEGRGVVAAASYEARRYGIHSAMPMSRAERLCPALVRVPPDFRKYSDDSRRIMEILGTFSPLVEPLSLDEAFLDLSGTKRLLGPPLEVGARIKERIRDATRLTASVGIAPVRFVAKIASDLKKPDGLVIVEGDVKGFLHPLPIGRLWGVGPRTREALSSLGITTIGDLAAFDPRRLERVFGRSGTALSSLARGEDERGVVPDQEAKSYSHEETFAVDRTDGEGLEGVLLSQAVRVARRLRADGKAGRVVQLKLRDLDFRTITRRRTLSAPTAESGRIFEAARDLFRTAWTGTPVRLIGVGVSGVVPREAENLELFAPRGGGGRGLSEVIDRIEERFGEGKLTPARLVHEPSALSENLIKLRPRSAGGSGAAAVRILPVADEPDEEANAGARREEPAAETGREPGAETGPEPGAETAVEAGDAARVRGPCPGAFLLDERLHRVRRVLRAWSEPSPAGEISRAVLLMENGSKWEVACEPDGDSEVWTLFRGNP